MARNTRAFTLIELLVVIAIIALLIGILLPSLGAARNVARQLVSSTTIRSLGQGQAQYSTDNREFFAGPNTSGAFYRVQQLVPVFRDNSTLLLGTTSSSTPTMTWDWISPSIGEGAALSANRAQRYWDIFNRLGSPVIRDVYDGYFGRPPEVADFTRVEQNKGRFKVASYLSPSNFHSLNWVRGDDRDPFVPLPARLGRGTYLHQNFSTPVLNRRGYFPRIDAIGGTASNKVLIMSGSRYVSATGINFDPDPAGLWGSFADPGPIFHRSPAFGRSPITPGGPGEAAKLAFRYNGKMLTGRFDGSGKLVTKEEAYADASLWNPAGSTFTGGEATPEATEKYRNGDVIQ